MIDFDALVLGPCMATFGEVIRYRTIAIPGAPAVTLAVTGIFDEPEVEQFNIESLKPGAVVNTRARLGVQLSQFALYSIVPAQDDVLTRASTGLTYQVGTVLADGHGGASLQLNSVNMANPP